MGRSTLCANGIMNRLFIRKGESQCRGILLDIRTRRSDAECMHKETNDGRGDGRRNSVCICSAEWNMSDHTSTNATDSIRTPQVKGAWARVVLEWVTSCEVLKFHPFSWEVLVLHPFFWRWFFRHCARLDYGLQVYSQMWVTAPWHFTWYLNENGRCTAHAQGNATAPWLTFANKSADYNSSRA